MRENILGDGGLGVQGGLCKQSDLYMQLGMLAEAQAGETERKDGMAGSRKQRIISSLYCISCGKQGIPIWREKAHIREQGHRKALYCLNCKTVINHIEVRTPEEREQFLKDFADGKYAEEAEASKAYAKEKEGRRSECSD